MHCVRAVDRIRPKQKGWPEKRNTYERHKIPLPSGDVALNVYAGFEYRRDLVGRVAESIFRGASSPHSSSDAPPTGKPRRGPGRRRPKGDLPWRLGSQRLER